MKPLEILIKEEPIPKGRPRTSWKNGKVHTYNPDRTTFAQERITACLQQYKDKAFPPHVAIKLTCTFYRTKSKWLPKYERMPYRKPDLTNFAKLLEDSIIGVLLPDDAQLTTLALAKRWTDKEYGYIIMKLEEDLG